jgi:hypothetical protein
MSEAVVFDVGNGRRVIVLAANPDDAAGMYFANTVKRVQLALEQDGMLKRAAAPEDR